MKTRFVAVSALVLLAMAGPNQAVAIETPEGASLAPPRDTVAPVQGRQRFAFEGPLPSGPACRLAFDSAPRIAPVVTCTAHFQSALKVTISLRGLNDPPQIVVKIVLT